MLRRVVLLALLILAAAAGARPGQDAGPKGDAEQFKAEVVRPGATKTPPIPAPPKPAPTTNDAIRGALADLTPVTLDEAPFYRWLWLRSQDETDYKRVVYTLNQISRASRVIVPAAGYPSLEALPLPGALLVRVYLPDFFPRAGDIEDALRTWELLAFDPDFSLLITPDTLRLAGFRDDRLARRQKKRFVRRPDGTAGWEVERINADPAAASLIVGQSGVIRLDPPDIDPEALDLLRFLTDSDAPVVNADYFCFRALSTIKDDGLFKDLFGGLYYDFRGIKKVKDVRGPDVKATDEDLYFENLGVGTVGVQPFGRLLDRVRGDLRPAMFVSAVTGKPRAVLAFHTPSEREGQSWGGVTWDLKDKSIDVQNNPVLSELHPHVDAQEAIFPGPNGFPVFALFNGVGDLQDEAPFDVVSDRSVPSPHTTRLQAAIGCIRCHGPTDMWQPLRDDVRTLVRGGRLNVLGDLSRAGDDVADTRDRILGLHDPLTDPEYLLQRSRQDFSRTVLKATGPWKRLAKERGAQTLAGQTACKEVADRYDRWWYEPVDAKRALAELGVEVDASEAPRILSALLPPAGGDPVLGVIYEDARLTALASGIPIRRFDWALVRSFAAGRTRTAAAALLATGK